MLTSCGGGGDGSGSKGASYASIAETYYPIIQGSTWVYDATDSSYPGHYFDTIKITGTKSISGVNTIVFKEDNPQGSGIPVEDYYYKDRRAFSLYGSNDPEDNLSPLVVPYDEMRFDGTLNAFPIVNKSDINIGVDLNDDGINEVVDILITAAVDGYETLATAVGTFPDTARLTVSITFTIKLSNGSYLSRTNLPISETITEWRAPGIGLVKQTIYTVSGGIQIDSSTMDIHGYIVGNAKGGYLTPATIKPNLEQATSDRDRPGRHAVGSDGDNFLLVGRTETGMQITSPLSKWFGQIVMADGTSQPPFDLSPSTDRWTGEAAVAFDGTNYLVLTDTASGILGSTPFAGITGRRIDKAGSIIDPYPGSTISATGINPSLAFGGGTYLAVYRSTSPPGGIYGALVSPAGVVGSEFPISTSTANAGFPSVAFDGSNFLVAWESQGTQYDPSTTDIYAARVSPNGAVLDPSGISIAISSEAQLSPHVDCDGVNCMVVWIDRKNYPGLTYSLVPLVGDVYAAMLNKDGVFKSGELSAIPISTGGAANSAFPNLAYTGNEYLVTWTNYFPPGPEGIVGARVSTEGNIVGDAISLSGPPAYAGLFVYSTIATSASGSLVTWLVNSELSGTSKSIDGALSLH